MKNTSFLILMILLVATGCRKEYNQDDLTSFELKYKTDSEETGYFYNLQVNEKGKLDIQSRKQFSDSVNNAAYLLDSQDLSNLKPLLLNLINSDIKRTYGDIKSQASDYPVKSITFKSNIRQIETAIYQVTESELPENLNKILDVVSGYQVKYDTLFNKF